MSASVALIVVIMVPRGRSSSITKLFSDGSKIGALSLTSVIKMVNIAVLVRGNVPLSVACTMTS